MIIDKFVNNIFEMMPSESDYYVGNQWNRNEQIVYPSFFSIFIVQL